jgi:hypothetical protein
VPRRGVSFGAAAVCWQLHSFDLAARLKHPWYRYLRMAAGNAHTPKA